MHRISILLAIAACAGTTSAPPARTSRGLRADQHLDAAHAHERRAEALARWPESRRGDPVVTDTGIWYRSFDTTGDERRSAAYHRAEADRLYAAYDDACEKIPPELVRISPLQRYGIGGTPIDDGIVIFLRPDAGTPDRLLAELRCHRAWMMLSAEPTMENCALDLPGIHVQAHGDATGISLEIRTRDPKLVPELQRRAAHDLEQ